MLWSLLSVVVIECSQASGLYDRRWLGGSRCVSVSVTFLISVSLDTTRRQYSAILGSNESARERGVFNSLITPNDCLVATKASFVAAVRL